MNIPATQEHRPLMALYKDEGRSVIARFFAAYDIPYLDPKASERGREAVLTAKAQSYLIGIEGIPEWALAEAFKDFVQGRIDRPERQRGKLPTAEQIGSVARSYVQAEALRQNAERVRQEALAPKEEVVKTPEMRARVQGMYERYCNERFGTRAEREAEELRREREEIRARYGMTDEAMESVPNRSIGAWNRAK